MDRRPPTAVPATWRVGLPAALLAMVVIVEIARWSA